MAASGSFNTSNYEGRYLKFSWNTISQSVENNTTTISWTLEGAGEGQAGYYYSGNFKVVIAGTTVYSSTDRIQLRNGTTVASGKFTFTHNDDGTKSFTASAEAGIYYYDVNCTGSGTFTLNTIARASQPSCITYPEHTQNVGNFGATISIHMNRKSSAFTHTVRYQFGTKSGTIATGVTTGTTWTIPLTLMDLIPAATKGSGTIYVDTYNDSTKIGTKSCGFTATVPSSVKPTCSFTLEDITGMDDIYGSPVKGLSRIKITVSATLAYSSPIASYKITANGATYTTATATTGFLGAAGTSRITATVTDKRGRSASYSYDMTVQEYESPVIPMLSVHRCNKDGTANDRGKYVEVLFSGEVYPMNNKNTSVYAVKYKKSADTSWTNLVTDANGLKPADLKNNYTVYNQSYIFEADVDSSYDVEVSISDKHSTTARSTSASTAFTLINFHTAGNGLRLGRVAEEENAFQNDLDFIQRGNRYVFSSPGVAGSAGYILMARMTHKKANADSPITFVFTQRLQSQPMTVHVQFKSDSTTIDPDLKSITYEGSNYGAFLVRSAESVWDLYVQKVSAYDTVTLQDWYSAKTISDRLTIEFVGSLASSVPQGLDGWYRATPAISRSVLDTIFPVGYILLLYSHTDPNTMYPGTTWTRIYGAFPWFTDGNGEIGLTGGERNVTLTVNQIPAHSHGSVYSQHATGTKDKAWYTTAGSSVAYGTVSTGGGAAHNNMPPYIQISAWRRTA